MKLSLRRKYALLALVYRSRTQQAYLPVPIIAEAQSIPPKYPEQILLPLKRAAYPHSSKGQGGGCTLAKLPSRMTLAEIIRLFAGPLAPTSSASVFFYESTPIENNSSLLSIFKDIRWDIANRLENLALADLQFFLNVQI